MNASFLSRLAGAPGIDPATAAENAAEGSMLLVDVRETDEYVAVRSVHAEHVPLGSLGDQVERLAAAGKPVAFVCRSGSRSAMATRMARKAGVEAHNVSGGMIAWEAGGLPVSRG
jgi:rhodanese-related sulfurtransferase